MRARPLPAVVLLVSALSARLLPARTSPARTLPARALATRTRGVGPLQARALRTWSFAAGAFLVAALHAVAVAQEYQVYNVSDSTPSVAETVVACGPNGAVLVAWEESPGEIWTRVLAGSWGESIHHGPGREPSVCFSAGEFALAYTAGSSLVVRHGDGHSWNPAQAIVGGGRPVSHPDLSAAPAGAAAQAYVVWQEEETEVWFSQRAGGVWGAAQQVVVAAPFVGEAMPQVAPAYAGGQVVPRVYYYDALAQIRYRQRAAGQWGEPVEVPGRNFAVEMSVAASPSLRHHILSLGPPPSCPCNHLNYVEELPGGHWAVVERLDVLIDFYNRPQYPQIALDEEARPRIFWYQDMHDGELQPTGDAMFYRVRENGTWTDHTEILGGRIGTYNGLAIDPQGRPVFAWVEETGGTRDAMMCRYVTSAGVAGATAGKALRLAAGPSPARGGLLFALELPEPAAARVEVFDASGRCVERILLGSLPAGRHSRWWRPAPERCAAGAYRARLIAGGRGTSGSLVIVY